MTIVLSPSSVAVSASQIPGRYDVIIDGKGYIFARQVDPSLPFRIQRARYSYSPTFIERTNITGDYGDNSQEFYLTYTGRDWSLGEQQKFAQRDSDALRRYWQGTNLDITIPGQATIRQAVKSLTFAAAVRATCPRGQGSSQNLIAASSTNLYEVDPAGALTDRGAHGLGAAPSRFGLATDGANVYASTTAAGTVGVRKWTGSAYSTWSATQADSLEFLNNSLYGLRYDTAELNVYSTAGAASQKFQWKDASGTARMITSGKIKAFGGKLLILLADGPAGPELWSYDGSSTSLIYTLPRNFYAHDIEVVFGIAFISGSTVRISNGDTSQFVCRPAIYYYASGSQGKLWESQTELPATSSVATAGHPALASFGSGMIFTDDTRGGLMFYEASTGGVHTIGTYTIAGNTPLLGATQRTVLHTRNQTTGYLYPDTTTIAASATMITPLVDFNNSLTKYFKGVTIDADIPVGSSFDLDYQLDSVDGAFTNIVTGGSSGTEYTIGQTARSSAVRVTLNKGSSALSPTLKRVAIRAVPILTTYKQREYILSLTGRDGKTPVILNDETPHPKDGRQMALDLVSALGVVVTIIDAFGSFSGVIQADGFEILEQRPEVYLARVQVRQA